MKNKSLISIVCPYYNKGKVFEKTLSSVLNQSYKNWELIIVDDHSSTPFLDTFDISGDCRISVIVNVKNLGPGPSRQVGANLAKGDFISFLDADDSWNDCFLETSLQLLNENLEVAAIWSPTYMSDDGVNFYLRRYNHLEHSDLINLLIKYRHAVTTSAYLWRKSSIADWSDLSTNQDSMFEFNCSLNNRRILKNNLGGKFFYDRSGAEHRSKYVNDKTARLNELTLYFIMKKTLDSLNMRHNRVVLFYRILLLVDKYERNYADRSWLELMNDIDGCLIRLISGNLIWRKLFLKGLAYSGFKAYS